PALEWDRARSRAKARVGAQAAFHELQRQFHVGLLERVAALRLGDVQALACGAADTQPRAPARSRYEPAARRIDQRGFSLGTARAALHAVRQLEPPAARIQEPEPVSGQCQARAA